MDVISTFHKNRVVVDSCVVCLTDDIQHFLTVKDHSISGENFQIAICNSCGFRFTQDPPTELECGAYYQSENYVSHSDTSTGLIHKIYHIVRNVMLGRKYKLIRSLGGNRSLLDLGSGTGYFPYYMQQKGYDVTGIEVDDKARKYSIDKFGLNVGTPQDLKSGNIGRSFGYITLWHVLEHLYDPDQYFRLFADLLEQEGHLIIAVPNHKSYDAKVYKDFWAAYDVPRHLWHFHPSTLEHLAVRNGFQVVDKKSMPFDPFYNSMLSEKYRNRSFGMIRALFVGTIALLRGWLDVDKASSVIYILRKK